MDRYRNGSFGLALGCASLGRWLRSQDFSFRMSEGLLLAFAVSVGIRKRSNARGVVQPQEESAQLQVVVDSKVPIFRTSSS